jgi:hypothetical protein
MLSSRGRQAYRNLPQSTRRRHVSIAFQIGKSVRKSVRKRIVRYILQGMGVYQGLVTVKDHLVLVHNATSFPADLVLTLFTGALDKQARIPGLAVSVPGLREGRGECWIERSVGWDRIDGRCLVQSQA